nr:endonuclease domain-containing protein [Rhizomicrobium electricum]
MRKQLTHAEIILWSRLRRGEQGGFRFRKQHPIGPYIADFACSAAKLIVEVDGETHGSDEEIRHDQRRDAYMRTLGWRVFRVTNEDVYKRLDVVLDGIARILQGTMEPPPVRRERSQRRENEPPTPAYARVYAVATRSPTV